MESDGVAIFLWQVIADCSPIDGTEAIHLKIPWGLKIELCIPRLDGIGGAESRQGSQKECSRRETHNAGIAECLFNRVLISYNIETLGEVSVLPIVFLRDIDGIREADRTPMHKYVDLRTR